LGTTKNSPFALWSDLFLQFFVAEIPQYTKFYRIPATRLEEKPLAQIIKKEFLVDAYL